MGLFDRSSSTTQNLEENINRPVNIQDSDDASVFDIQSEGEVTIVSTDHNAFDRATELASRSLSVGENLALESFQTSRELSRGVIDASRYAQDLVAETTGDALDFADDVSFNALSKVQQAAQSALSFADDISFNALSRVGDALNTVADSSAESRQDALSFAGTLQTKFQDTISSTVDALQRIGVEQNKSTDQRLAETSERTLRYALIGLGVMAAGLALAFARR